MATSKHTPFQIPLPIDNETFEIPLSKGYVAIVSAIDADLAQFKWYAFTTNTTNKWYATRSNKTNNGKNKWLLMHRVILSRMLGRDLLQKEQVDHINRNPLDNRRENLRLATSGQNKFNIGLRSDNKSGIKGVRFNEKTGRWQAGIQFQRKHYSLGGYATKEEAAEAYRKKALELHGEFATFE